MLKSGLRSLGTIIVTSIVVLVGFADPAVAQKAREAQWHLDALDVPEAQTLATGAGTKVAVLANFGINTTDNGLTGQTVDGTFIPSDTSADEPDKHDLWYGTAFAGIIAAKAASADDLLGIAPNTQLIPIGLPEFETADNLAEGIRWAADHDADVIAGVSRTTGLVTQALLDAVKYAMSKDIVIVTHAGTNKSNEPHTLSKLRGVVVVSGLDESLSHWDESRISTTNAISAPAVNVNSVLSSQATEENWTAVNSTQSAAAIVAGAAALIRSLFPDLDAANVINRLITTVDSTGLSGRSTAYGYGELDILAALTAEVPTVTTNPLETSAPAERDSAVLTYLPIAVGTVGLVALLIAAATMSLVSSRRRRRGPRRGTPWPPQQRVR